VSEDTFSDLIGLTFSSVSVAADKETMTFEADDGRAWKFYHAGDCCETVAIEDVIGDLSDLVGSPLVMADESTNKDNPPENADSWTWTFYKFATAKGYVTVRWLGQSNGYYSEQVDFARVR
jgi:hypothetical protein